MESLDILKTAIKALDSKKGFDLEVIKVEDVTTLADYFVIVSGASTTQVKSLANEVDYKLGLEGVEPNHIEGKSSGWILLDYSDVLVHIFTRDTREYYDLERLWSDATPVDISDLITED